VQSFIITLFICSFTMALLALVYKAITPLFLKRYRAKWCYYAWLIIIVGLILFPFIPFRLHIRSSLVKIPLPSEGAARATMEGFPIFAAHTQNWMESTASSLSSLSVWEIITAIWALGVVVFFVYHVIRHYRFMAMVRRWSDEITDAQTLSVFSDAKEQTGIRGKVGIRKCYCVYTPMLTGLIRPSVLLPDDIYEPEELIVILKHELIHLQRKDLWYRVLVIVTMGIHWFNPFLYSMVKEIAALCELSCDDEMVRDSDFDLRQQYSTIILCSAKGMRPQTAFSTDFAGGQRNMRRRIASIMDITTKRTGLAMICVLLLLAFGVSSAFSVSETPVSYIDATFMKERILSGAASGDFSTDGYIIYPQDGDINRVPMEPAENRDAYSDIPPVGAAFIELRYRYPLEMVQKDETGKKYVTRVYFDYDYVLSGSIKYEELNSLIGSYLTTFEAIFKNASFEELTRKDGEGIYSMMKQCKEYVDNNADPRVYFLFARSGIGGDAFITVPEPEKDVEFDTLWQY